MDKDRVAGAAKQAKGSVEGEIGKVTGDSKTEAEEGAVPEIPRSGFPSIAGRMRGRRHGRERVT